MRRALILIVAALLTAVPSAQQAVEEVVLKPTAHPRMATDLSQMWMVPARAKTAVKGGGDFAAAVKLEVDGDFAKALPIFSRPAMQQGPLGDYALYYQGLAELRVGRPADARKTFQALQAKAPVGFLAEGAAMREAECDEALGDREAALAIYERLSQMKTTAPEEVLMHLGQMARATGSPDKAVQAFSRVLYEFPFSDAAAAAGTELDSLPLGPISAGTNRYKLELGRAERLFGARRYSQARPVFESVRAAAQGDERELVNLRLAECDYFLKRPRNARDGVKPYIEKASRQGEALYFYAIAIRELGSHDEYLHIVRRIVDEFPTQSWAEEALNNLATHYILQNEDAKADAAFRELYEKYPTGHYAERAAWKLGWFAYRNGRYRDTIRAFESAAAHFPRSDYRPSWLYWSARAHGALKETAVAEARYALTATDYQNSYYGRLAAKHLDARERRAAADAAPITPAETDDGGVPPATLPPNEATVRALLALDLYDQALDELHYAQKVWSDSAPIQATIAWILHERGDLRAGINAMKRAYPQYLAAGGEKLPREMMEVLFPVSYWPQIKRYAQERNLDPYMIAALILQESNFTANIKSPANAYGLMQIVPATGRQYARMLKLPKFSIGMLTTAETNLKMGTAYFADLIKQFGGAHFALATYNAGPSRIARWKAEKPGLDQDEFIDDIPFPETQNYVKRILGQAEDYRRLYGGAESRLAEAVDATPAVARPTPAKAAAAAPVKKKPAPTKRKAKKAA